MAGFGGLSFRAHKTRDENSGRNAPHTPRTVRKGKKTIRMIG